MKNMLHKVGFNIDKTEKCNNHGSLTFTAIDFETAQGPRISICQVGIVRVENNIITERYSTLIQPPENKYQKGNIGVHGITPEMTKHAKTFAEVWPKIKPYIKNELIVTHNASFDIDALNKTLTHYKIKIPKFNYDCTLKLLGKGLGELCKENNIHLIHHDGLSDAEACAKLYLQCHNQKIPDLNANALMNCYQKPNGHQRIKGDVLKPNLDEVENTDNPFYGKKVVVSGTYSEWPDRNDLAILLKSYGADIDTSVTARTNILCAGSGVGPKKLERMQKNKADGKDAIIINEEVILEMLVEFEFEHQR